MGTKILGTKGTWDTVQTLSSPPRDYGRKTHTLRRCRGFFNSSGLCV